MEINKKKLQKIEKAFSESKQDPSTAMVFGLAEVINPEPELPEFGKDRQFEEERQSQYVILVKGGKRQKRTVIVEVSEVD